MDTSIFSALFQQVVNSPASLLLIVALSIVAYLLEIWPSFPSKFIPHICVVLGMLCYPLFSSRASVPAAYPNPLAVLMVNGLVVGFIATIAHLSLISWLIKRFGPAQQPGTQGSQTSAAPESLTPPKENEK